MKMQFNPKALDLDFVIPIQMDLSTNRFKSIYTNGVEVKTKN